MSFRRPTNPDCNATPALFAGTGSTKHCMSCNRWRPMAGGRKNPRTGLWQCACCKPAPFGLVQEAGNAESNPA